MMMEPSTAPPKTAREGTLFWPGLPLEAQTALEQAKSLRTYSKGQVLTRPGEAPKGMYFIQKGLVGLVMVGTAGNEHLLRLFKAGQHFGHRSLFANENYRASTITLEETTIAFVDKDLILRLVREYDLIAFALLEIMSKELKRAEQLRISISDKDVISRIAESVLYLKELYPEHQWTRKEIADFCCSTTPTVSRTLASFEAAGYIRQTGRKIEITKRDPLVELAATE